MRYLVVLGLALMLTPPARAAELIMFEQKGCVWCQRFDREIAPAYEKTTEGKRAPLRRVDIAKPQPLEFAYVQRERYTPVFVLVENGREFGRIRGYPGDTFFWGMLANLIERLDRGEAVPSEAVGSVPPGASFAE
jgi:thioredoxin-related protein